MDTLARIRKAIVGAITTGVGVYGAIVASGVHVDPVIALGAAVGAGLVGGFVVWLVPNAPAA